ncbi:MAG: hypothetical protein ABW051_03795 [Burkholderiaceae bacterium]
MPIDRTPHFGEIMQKPVNPFPKSPEDKDKGEARDDLPEIDPEAGDRPPIPNKPKDERP